MEIIDLVHQKFSTNSAIHHSLIENAPDGILACGFICKNTTIGSHIHATFDFYSALYILSGNGIYEDGTVSIPLKAGDFVQRFPNHTHSTLVTSNDWEEIYVCFGASLFHTLVQLNVLSTKKPVMHIGTHFNLIESFIVLHDKLSTAQHADLPGLIPSAIQFITEAYALDRQSNYSTVESDLLKESQSIINTHLDSRIPIESIAASINMGYEKYRKSFFAHFGISPGNYIILQRVRKSQKMLSDTNFTIKEIALQLGYPDAYTFSKQFKKTTGLPPNQFRRFFRQQGDFH